MVPGSFHDFFIGAGQVAGALVGLLFVAIQISPDKVIGRGARIEQRLKVATAFSALIDTLFLSLAALLPDTNLGQVGVILAILGLSSMLGLLLLTVWERGWRALRPRGLIFPLTLSVVFGFQLYDGIRLVRSPQDVAGVNALATLAMILFAIAITRAWDLVGAPAAGLLATVGKLTERKAAPQTEDQEPTDERPAPRPDG